MFGSPIVLVGAVVIACLIAGGGKVVAGAKSIGHFVKCSVFVTCPVDPPKPVPQKADGGGAGTHGAPVDK